MKTILFIHGMFQNPKSWDNWVDYFTRIGYNCIAPAWPRHEGEPEDLRKYPPEKLGDLHLKKVIKNIEALITVQDEPPILIGHSVGGLIVQLMVAKGMADSGVAISSVAPNGMLAFDWGFMKNSALIANPFKGNEPFFTDLETFHAAFCNTMSLEEAKLAFEETATHDSRNILRDCMGEEGQIDTALPHAPLLFIGAEKDEIIPAELCERNAKAYTDDKSIADYKEFAGRTHWICGQDGWQKVAAYISKWLEIHESAKYPTESIGYN
ncbi:alpha/beta hydrolase [Mucilaginibacter phyllosphaerae]|uniref:Alpha/beta hydrolase n=1 Tax=Mucilaginibacter phyllosphaerae TaxID=1812349 RepID=A0A4Y8AJA3_9SPHI|nr:alpha/beta hydrolase [Mucilaginibacter phyllosphaerae]MBB3967849.1 pimeloyl-ACP methyl ester carboxylesterase [Mucilaginibacter phyllosphaerae]TEW69107.1 alpha/beta hydrolase [Mucilaginibacter phyllosphaerae]GGH02884.1 alpha/beta hydrolase [Mucilaginibacter phyllosphaerae]